MNPEIIKNEKSNFEYSKALINLIEQLEQIIEALVKLIDQIESCLSDLEYSYDFLLLYPENSLPIDFEQLLSTYPVQRIKTLEQQVNNLIVTMQSNRKDLEKEIERIEHPEEYHTTKLTRTKLFNVLQTFTELIERYALNKNQFQIKLKRIMAKQVKCINLSFTERALDQILEVDLRDEMVEFDNSSFIFKSLKNKIVAKTDQEEKQDEFELTKQNLTKLFKLINKCYLSVNGLFTSTNTMFIQFCIICEFTIKRKLIAEVEEISFMEIVDFTTKVANKMKTDYMLEYSSPILLPKKQKKKVSICLSIFLLILGIILVVTVLIYFSLGKRLNFFKKILLT